jgi:hypothetical protein
MKAGKKEASESCRMKEKPQNERKGGARTGFLGKPRRAEG